MYTFSGLETLNSLAILVDGKDIETMIVLSFDKRTFDPKPEYLLDHQDDKVGFEKLQGATTEWFMSTYLPLETKP